MKPGGASDENPQSTTPERRARSPAREFNHQLRMPVGGKKTSSISLSKIGSRKVQSSSVCPEVAPVDVQGRERKPAILPLLPKGVQGRGGGSEIFTIFSREKKAVIRGSIAEAWKTRRSIAIGSGRLKKRWGKKEACVRGI